MRTNRLWVVVLAVMGVLGGVAGAAPKPTTNPSTEARDALRQAVEERIGKILTLAGEPKKYGDAVAEARSLLAGVAWVARPEDSEAVIRAAWLQRLLVQMSEMSEKQRDSLLRYLLEKEKLARAVAFGTPANREETSAIYELLDKLRKERGAAVERLPNLAAAIAITHGGGLRVYVNENTASASDGLAVLDYYVANERRMMFPIRSMSTDLLTFVVDWAAGVDEMRWALEQWQGNQRVGDLYGRIMYDSNNFTLGTEKEITKKGFTLQNILKYGGVCADQGYFAATVGKAIGVPTAVAGGKGANVGHAWVGYLAVRDGKPYWNDENGRYEEYKRVQGRVQDPRSRRSVPDAFIALEMESAGEKGEVREEAAAWVDAGRALALGNTKPDAAILKLRSSQRKATGIAAGLELIEWGLTRSNCYGPGWMTIAELASRPKQSETEDTMSYADRAKWFAVAQKLGGDKYPDFMFEITAALIGGVENVADQNAMWEKMIEQHRARRLDLVVRAKMGQARMWEKQSQWAKAGGIYEEIIKRLINDTEDAMDALDGAERMLDKLGLKRRMIDLYQFASDAVAHPGNNQGIAIRGTNWFRIKNRYIELLEDAGRYNEAQRIRTQMGIIERPKKDR